jgi:SAM-dependent methyltransferase
MITVLRKVMSKGPRGIASALRLRIARPVHLWRARSATEYQDPNAAELAQVEAGFAAAGIAVGSYFADSAAYREFVGRSAFPHDYHGGELGGVYTEKVLEHFVAWDLLELGRNPLRLPYLDIAGASSPWAKLLRNQGLEAFSIDLAAHPSFAQLEYYLQGDATRCPFATESVGSASLQCAYEMFVGDADTRLLRELARILRPGGRAVISPLYMHTHACYYQSPEYFGRPVGDDDAVRYVRRHAWSVPASRKYSVQSFRTRVWDPALQAGLRPQLQVLRNKASFGAEVYLHFILTLDKPVQAKN